jgi:hypothetical protein
MGGAQSSSSGIFSGIPSAPTGNEFSQHAKTKELKAMSDALFEFMYSKWDIREIFEITEKPGDYVIAISDLITSEFHVLGYTTKRNKIGEIYFQKWEKLDPPQTSEELSALRTSYSSNVTRSARLKKKEERMKKLGVDPSRGEPGSKAHAQHAKIISFYFVVIFQILGSLLLVLKDTELPELNSSGEYITDSLSARERAYAQQATLPLFRPIQGGQRGGSEAYYDLNEPLGAFEFLRYYLRKYDQETVERYSRDLKLQLPPPNTDYYKFANNDSLLFKFKKPDRLPDQVSAKETAELVIFAKAESESTYQKKIIQIKVEALVPDHPSEYKPPSAYRKEERLNKFPYQVTLETSLKRQGSSNALTSAIFQKNDETDMNREYERGVKYKIISSERDRSSFYDVISSSSKKIIPTEIEKILEKFILVTLNKTSSETVYPFKIKSIDEKERSARDSSESKAESPKFNPGLAETFKDLNNVKSTNSSAGYKHVPHCIKRAQDLLNLQSINDFSGLKPAETRICASDIKGSASSYVPLKSIASLYGKLNAGAIINVDEVEFNKAIKVLDAFVGKSSKGYLTVSELNEAGQESEANELSSALKRLSKSFNQLQDANKLNKLEDITLYKPTRCAGNNTIQRIDTARPVFKTMQGYSRQLLGFHLNNVINISKFLMTIFNVSQRPDGSWKVEGPKTEILFAGFSVLDVLKDQARELLLSYYTGCEDIYQKGVKEWNDDTDAPAVAAASAAASAAAAAPLATNPPAAVKAIASANRL